MTERPIIFSRPMVKALLAGTKTQTRRVVTQQPGAHVTHVGYLVRGANHPERPHFLAHWMSGDPTDIDLAEFDGEWFRCPYGELGATLWVRETWAPLSAYHGKDPGTAALATGGFYRADYPDGDLDPDLSRWRPSIHMPRIAARIFLRVSAIRIERLHEISEADARAEGWSIDTKQPPVEWYRELWDSINAERGFRWLANPWVWAVTFERIRA